MCMSEQLLAEAVDRRAQRDQHERHAGEEARQPAGGAVDLPPAADVEERQRRDEHDRARLEGPAGVGRDGEGRGEDARDCASLAARLRRIVAIRASAGTRIRATIRAMLARARRARRPAALRGLRRARPAAPPTCSARPAGAALPWLRAPCCARCALPLPHARGRCPARDAAFDAAWAAVAYEGAARDAMHALKFAAARPLAAGHGRPDRRRRAAGAAARRAARDARRPCPPHPRRRRARGFDPAELIAVALARRTGLPLRRVAAPRPRAVTPARRLARRPPRRRQPALRRPRRGAARASCSSTTSTRRAPRCDACAQRAARAPAASTSRPSHGRAPWTNGPLNPT